MVVYPAVLCRGRSFSYDRPLKGASGVLRRARKTRRTRFARATLGLLAMSSEGVGTVRGLKYQPRRFPTCDDGQFRIQKSWVAGRTYKLEAA